MKQRIYTSDEKLSVVIEMMKGKKTVAQICKEHGIRDSMAYKWKDEALEAMKKGLSDKRSSRPQNNEAEKERLLKIIGQQAVIIDFQKKITQELSV